MSKSQRNWALIEVLYMLKWSERGKSLPDISIELQRNHDAADYKDNWYKSRFFHPLQGDKERARSALYAHFGQPIVSGYEERAALKNLESLIHQQLPLGAYDLDKVCFGSLVVPHYSVPAAEHSVVSNWKQELTNFTMKIKDREPPCTCDSKVLVSYGCQCNYAKWKHSRSA